MWGNTFRKKASAVESLFVSGGVSFTLCAVYALLNIFLFGFSAVQEYERHQDLQKYTTTIARGCGATLNLNLAVVLLLASRSFVSFLRETPLSLLVSLDSLMPSLHGVIGLIVLVAGVIHALTHWATYIVKNPWGGGAGGPTYLFVTGVLLALSIVVIRIAALQSVRQKHHEVFKRCHLGGSLATYILLSMHGLHRGTPSSWKWVLFPVILFAADAGHRMMKEKRSYLLISKHSALFQGQSVLKLRLPPVFHYKPGQYAEIKVPSISKSQWHPFTIASAPHEEEMVFYVKAAGNWTSELFQLFAERFRDDSSDDIQVHVRGPFGAPAQHVEHFDHLVLIGGGVGATPFCSIVKSLDNYMTHWQRNRSRNHSKTALGQGSGSTGEYMVSSGTRQMNDSDTTSSLSHTVREITDLSVATFSSEQRPATISGAVDELAPQGLQIPPPSRRAFKNSSVHAASIRADREGFRQRTTNPSPDRKNEWHDVAKPVSHASKASYWQAVNSLYGDAESQTTCKESFDILVGMSFGTPALVRQLQRHRKEEQVPYSGSIGAGFSNGDGDIDLGIFRDKAFLFLVYMKSVTANLALLWILLCRGILAGAAAMFEAVSVQRNGFAIYSSRILLSIDLILSALVAGGVAVPAFLEVYKLGPSTRACWFDLFILTPCASFSVVANILAFAGVATSLEYAGSLTLFVIWPLTAFLFVLRLIHVVGERVSMGDGGLRPTLKGAHSVEFHWTTPTSEDDSWLVEELCRERRSKRTKLYRYITRQRHQDEAEGGDGPRNLGIEKTQYCRPDWFEIMNDVAERSKNGSRVGVFLCGPASMANQVQDALQTAMKNSIIRGLQGNAHVVRSLEEVFGAELTANEYTGDTLEAGGPEQKIGCNIRMVFHKERFS